MSSAKWLHVGLVRPVGRQSFHDHESHDSTTLNEDFLVYALRDPNILGTPSVTRCGNSDFVEYDPIVGVQWPADSNEVVLFALSTLSAMIEIGSSHFRNWFSMKSNGSTSNEHSSVSPRDDVAMHSSSASLSPSFMRSARRLLSSSPLLPPRNIPTRVMKCTRYSSSATSTVTRAITSTVIGDERAHEDVGCELLD